MKWNHEILGFLGLWPNKENNFRFFSFLTYLVIHVSLEYAYLTQHINQLDCVVVVLTENIPFAVLLLKAVLFRNKKSLLREIINETYKDLREPESNEIDGKFIVVLRYNAMSEKFICIAVPLVFLTSIVYYCKPLLGQLGTVQGNNTSNLELPYHVYPFYGVQDPRVYSAIYGLQMPLVLIATFGYTGTDCLMVTLTFHICGQLSTLDMRIRRVRYHYKCRDSQRVIRVLIERHVHLIRDLLRWQGWDLICAQSVNRMARLLEDIFNTLLLAQLLGATFLICFLGCSFLTNANCSSSDMVNFSLFGISVLLSLFAYCYIGDCLICESEKLKDAFFHHPWYELPTARAKSLVICIIQSQKPLHLTAGKFYVFSLPRFADVIKTSMAYLSVLRTLL